MKCPPPFDLRALGAAVSFCLAIATAPDARASTFGTGGTEAVVPGTGDVVHTFTESGTFTLSEAKTVRLLVVGGGGGGGSDCAGGGGGGGVIAVDSVALPAGDYTVTVGAGGAGGTSSQNGSIGGATTIADANGTVLYKALGGGGGVGYKGSTPVSTAEAPFASGGGGENKKAGSEPGDATQGHAGGTSTSCKSPQGGGGAGGPATPMNNTGGSNDEKNWPSGNGGPGLVSDIRGVSEMFGAGGGGGAGGERGRFRARPGAGGDGIGGFGAPGPWRPCRRWRSGFPPS